MGKLDVSLTREELDRFLESQRTLRLATCGQDGDPQVVPLWYAWVDGALFVNSTQGNRTVRAARAHPRAAATIDDGVSYGELRGVVLRGNLEDASDDPRLPAARSAFSTKYYGGGDVPFDRWRGRMWFRLVPDGIASWDFRKIPEARARRDRKEGGR